MMRGLLLFLLALAPSVAGRAEQCAVRARDLGIPFDGTTGTCNAITDVKGVLVGHATINKGKGKHAIRTGVTAILANEEVRDVFAAVFRHNGDGEMTGTHSIEEKGYLDSPVMLTNTISVGTVHSAVIRWSRTTKGIETVNLPVVAETWDGELNDIYGFHVKRKHVFRALKRATSGPVQEGNVGGGTGMIAHEFKGGIGTSSRVLPEWAGGFVVGVLVQANYGDRQDFRVAGIPVGRELRGWKPKIKRSREEKGSIIVVVATDAPLLPHQLKRVAKRVSMGLARNGSYASSRSGDLFLTFSTAPVERSFELLQEDMIDEVFRATIQATEEAIINAMVAAESMTGVDGNRVCRLPHKELQDVLRKYRRLVEPRSHNSRSGDDESIRNLQRITEPTDGKLYHGVYPGSPIRDSQKQVQARDVFSYVRQAGKPVAWVYFSNEWSRNRRFPRATVDWIDSDVGAVPFIRLMLRSSEQQEHAKRERYYTLQRIIDGRFDDSLRRWAQNALNYGKPLIVEYGTECNGDWFPWNGKHNGGATKNGFCDPDLEDGPERFVHAYRHIIKLMRDDVGATNITWVFHVNMNDGPPKDWNKLENYYPDNRKKYPHDGPDFIDWLAVSCYGAQMPKPLPLEEEDPPGTFREIMDVVYCRLQKMAPKKPVVVAEFGTTSGYFENHPKPANKKFKPGNWADAALEDLLSKRWKRVIGFSWWNEFWANDDKAEYDTNMRLECVYDLSQSFRKALEKHSHALQGTPRVKCDP